MVANTLDSNSGSGSQGTPNPTASDSQNGQPNSPSAPTQSPDQLNNLVQAAVSKAFEDPRFLQSLKDKTLTDQRFERVVKTLNDFQPVLEKVKGILTPEQQAQFAQIQRDAEFEDLKQQVYGNSNTQTGATASGTQGGAAIDVEAIVKTLQFADNDPALAALKIKYAGKPQELVSAAADLRIQQLTTPSPTPGTSFSPTGAQQGKATPQQIEEKSATLARLYDNYDKNAPQIQKLEKELAEYWEGTQ